MGSLCHWPHPSEYISSPEMKLKVYFVSVSLLNINRYGQMSKTSALRRRIVIANGKRFLCKISACKLIKVSIAKWFDVYSRRQNLNSAIHPFEQKWIFRCDSQPSKNPTISLRLKPVFNVLSETYFREVINSPLN